MFVNRSVESEWNLKKWAKEGRYQLSLDEEDIKRVLMCDLRLPQSCNRDMGSSGTLSSVD